MKLSIDRQNTFIEQHWKTKKRDSCKWTEFHAELLINYVAFAVYIHFHSSRPPQWKS